MTVHAKAEEKTFCRMRLARPQSLLQNSYKIGQVGTAMPEALVRGVRINYEVIGDHGPWIALTPGSRRSFDELIDL